MNSELLISGLLVAAAVAVLIVLCRIRKTLDCIEWHADRTANNTERGKMLK